MKLKIDFDLRHAPALQLRPVGFLLGFLDVPLGSTTVQSRLTYAPIFLLNVDAS